MGFQHIEHDCVVANVQRLFCADNSKASANVIGQTDGDRRKAFYVDIGVGCTYGAVVDLDGGNTNFPIPCGNVPLPQVA